MDNLDALRNHKSTEKTPCFQNMVSGRPWHALMCSHGTESSSVAAVYAQSCQQLKRGTVCPGTPWGDPMHP